MCNLDKHFPAIFEGLTPEQIAEIQQSSDEAVLRNAACLGKVTAEIAKAHAESEFEKYRITQDRLFESDFDQMVKLEFRPVQLQECGSEPSEKSLLNSE